MNVNRFQPDRRREHRYPSAERVTWKKTGIDRDFMGYVSDRSQSSVAFIAAARHTPALGQQLEIIGPDLSQENCRVTRIAPYDDHIALIACRTLD